MRRRMVHAFLVIVFSLCVGHLVWSSWLGPPFSPWLSDGNHCPPAQAGGFSYHHTFNHRLRTVEIPCTPNYLLSPLQFNPLLV